MARELHLATWNIDDDLEVRCDGLGLADRPPGANQSGGKDDSHEGAFHSLYSLGLLRSLGSYWPGF
jgi:hypothetical protein